MCSRALATSRSLHAGAWRMSVTPWPDSQVAMGLVVSPRKMQYGLSPDTAAADSTATCGIQSVQQNGSVQWGYYFEVNKCVR